MPSLDQALADHPSLDDVGDLGIVLVLHHHVRVALDTDVGEVDHVDGSPTGAYRLGIGKIGFLVRRPARMLVDIVAKQQQRGRVLQRARLADVAGGGRLDRNDRLDLVGALLRDLEAERAALAVQQQHAGADLIH